MRVLIICRRIYLFYFNPLKVRLNQEEVSYQVLLQSLWYHMHPLFRLFCREVVNNVQTASNPPANQ